VERLAARIAVVTNVELDHHAEYASEAEVAELLERWLAAAPASVRGWELDAAELELAVPGEHNRRNAATALAALELAGVPSAEAAPVLTRFEGVGRRFQVVGEAGGVIVVDDYAHHPSEIAATIAAAREQDAARVIVLFQPHLYSRTRHLAAELGTALSAADAVCVTDVYPAREEPVEGVDGLLVVRALAPDVRAGWSSSVDDGVRVVSSWARPGDLVLAVGAGDVERAGPLLLERLA